MLGELRSQGMTQGWFTMLHFPGPRDHEHLCQDPGVAQGALQCVTEHILCVSSAPAGVICHSQWWWWVCSISGWLPWLLCWGDTAVTPAESHRTSKAHQCQHPCCGAVWALGSVLSPLSPRELSVKAFGPLKPAAAPVTNTACYSFRAEEMAAVFVA